MQLVERTLFNPGPRRGELPRSYSLYTRREGPQKMRVDTTITIDDNIHRFRRAFSEDHGEGWSPAESLAVKKPTPKGMRRWHLAVPWVDPRPRIDRLLTVLMDGVLPVDDPFAALRQWFLKYRVSLDGGRTDVVDEQIIQAGGTAACPFPGACVGNVGAMPGDLPMTPLLADDGAILVPVSLTCVGADGRFANPGVSEAFLDAAVLRGRWRPDHRLEWTLSPRVRIDPSRSSRGLCEPVLASMPGGRVLMVMRGGNNGLAGVEGVKFRSISDDHGASWSAPEPWRFSDGSTMYSPGSCSQLLRHSSGTWYWLGNVCPDNPQGSYPRYPLVIAVVDAATMAVVRESLFVVDTYRPESDPEPVMLSSFRAHEDRRQGDILLHLTRAFRHTPQEYGTGDAFLYRLRP